MQTFGPQTAAVFLGTDVQYVPASGRNQDIYDAAADILGDSVLLNSVVVESVRLPGNLGVELLVQDQVHGNYTIILAERLVIAIEPTASNMAAFSLDETESAIFNQATWSVVNTGIVSHPSLPVDGLIYNLPTTAVNGNDFAYPEPPFVDYFEVSHNPHTPVPDFPDLTQTKTSVPGRWPLASYRSRLARFHRIRSTGHGQRGSPSPGRRRHDPSHPRHQSDNQGLVEPRRYGYAHYGRESPGGIYPKPVRSSRPPLNLLDGWCLFQSAIDLSLGL